MIEKKTLAIMISCGFPVGLANHLRVEGALPDSIWHYMGCILIGYLINVFLGGAVYGFANALGLITPSRDSEAFEKAVSLIAVSFAALSIGYLFFQFLGPYHHSYPDEAEPEVTFHHSVLIHDPAFLHYDIPET